MPSGPTAPARPSSWGVPPRHCLSEFIFFRTLTSAFVYPVIVTPIAGLMEDARKGLSPLVGLLTGVFWLFNF